MTTSVVQKTTEVVTTTLTPRRGSHQNDFIHFSQACIHPIQIPDMCTVDEDIEMLAKLALRVHQVELDWRILLYDLIHYFLHCRSWYVKFRLIINIIFHHGGEAYGWHEGIVIQ